MVLNRKRKFLFCTDYESSAPNWLPLSAGFFQRSMSRSSEKLAFFPIGEEENPREEILSSVKAVSFRGQRVPGDAAQEKILSLHGETVGFLEYIPAKNGENKGIFSLATVEVADDGSGDSDQEQQILLRFLCGGEKRGIVSLNGKEVTFTQQEEEA